MTGDEIKPTDVYERVGELYRVVVWLAWMTGVLCLLVVLQIIAKALIFSRVLQAQRRTEKLLTLIERHGRLTDDKANSMEDSTRKIEKTVKTATQEVVTKVSEVPEAVKAVVVEAVKGEKRDGQ